jgi:indolepyruvate ferredoxin oxidoreductase, alpha subunit
VAERSFAREMQDLTFHNGEEFRGKAFSPLPMALLQSGLSYVGGYQRPPISHLMDVLAEAKDVLGVHSKTPPPRRAACTSFASPI